MAQTMRFVNDKDSKQKTNSVVHKAVFDAAQLKYGKTKALPKNEVHSILMYTEDTGELFMGMGGSSPIKKLSDVVVLPTVNDLPAPGVTDRLYIAQETNTMHYWDGAQYQTIGAAGGTSTITVTPRIFEYDKKEDFPATGIAPAIYIEKQTGFLYRFEGGAYVGIGGAGIVGQIAASVQSLQNDVKDLDKKKADAKNLVTIADVARIAKAEAAKINVPDVSDFATKDEVARKADVTSLALKADKKEVEGKANISDLALKADKTALDAKADKTDLMLKADKTDLEQKADKTDLTNLVKRIELDSYRRLDDPIHETDLDQDLQDKFAGLPVVYATDDEIDAAFDEVFGAPTN